MGLSIDTYSPHCGGEVVDFQTLQAIPTPAGTDTFFPVAHHSMVELVKEEAALILPNMPLVGEAYGINRKGAQFFGWLAFEGSSPDHRLQIGMRGSHDHSLKREIRGGNNVFVCDNMMMTGDDMHIVRKHTQNVWRDLVTAVRESLHAAPMVYERLMSDTAAMEARLCSEGRGAELIGKAIYNDVLTPRQAKCAIDDWKNVGTENVRNEAHDQRTAWGLYNCFTEGLKLGNVGDVMERHASAHEFFRQQFWIPEPMKVVSQA